MDDERRLALALAGLDEPRNAVVVQQPTPCSSARCRSATRRSTSSRSRSRRGRTCPATSTSSAPRRPPSRTSSARRHAPSPRPRARMRPVPCPARGPARTGGRSRGGVLLLPLEGALPPDVHVRHHQDHDEEEELQESEPGELMQDHRQRIQEDDLGVEDDEAHGGEVETDREPLLAWRPGGHDGLDRNRPRAQPPVWSRRKREREPHHRCRNDQREDRVDQERQPVVEYAFLPPGDGNLTGSFWRHEAWRKRLNLARDVCYKVTCQTGDSQKPRPLLRSVSKWRFKNGSCR